MSTLYEIVELANGDIALQKEGENKLATNRAPLVTMRFSTDLVRFLRTAKMDVAKVMVEAGLERVANLAESVSRADLEAKVSKPNTFSFDRRSKTTSDRRLNTETVSNFSANISKSNSRQDQSNSSNGKAYSKSSSSELPENHNTSVVSSEKAKNQRAFTSKTTYKQKQSGRGNTVKELAADMEELHPTISHLLH